MKPRYRAARDRYEDEWIDLARDYGTAALNEWRGSGHLKPRRDEQDPEYQKRDCPNLHERAEVIARAQQHPDRKDGGDKSVCRHHINDGGLGEGKTASQ